MSLESRVAYLEALLTYLVQTENGLGLETNFSHPTPLSIGTRQPIGLRVEAADGGTVDPSREQMGVYGTVETATGAPEHTGLVGSATNGAMNTGVKGRAQLAGGKVRCLVGEEIAGNAESTVLGRITLAPGGIVAEGVANPLGSFAVSAGGYALFWEGGHVYWQKPDGSRSLVQGT